MTAATSGPTVDARVFGVPVRLDREVEGLEPLATVPDEPTLISEASPAEVRSWGSHHTWPELATAPPRSQFPDAERVLVVGRKSSKGKLRLWTPQAGDFLIEPDGMTVRTCTAGVDPREWGQMLLAQVLPLVAVLRGHEVLHASGVLFGESAIALVGSSGMGKSTFSTHLVNLGGTLISDDVVALTEEDGHVLAHPGPAVANVDRSAWPDSSDRRHPSEKERIEVATTSRPCRVTSVYFLERLPAGAAVQVESVEDPRRFLANVFVNYVRDADRLTRQLSLYATLARSAHVSRAAFPLTTSTANLASHLLVTGP